MNEDWGNNHFSGSPDHRRAGEYSFRNQTRAGADEDNFPEKPFWFDELDDTFDVKPPKASLSLAKKMLIGLGLALVLMVAATGTYVLAFYNQVQETQRVLIDDVVFEETYDVGEAFPEHIVNIALFGFDRGWNREAYGEYLFRPDMQAVISIDLEQDRVSIVRISRDAYVPIYGMGSFFDKINHSYFYGHYYGSGEDAHAEGIRFALLTLSNVLGDIPIHYYISVDMYSIIELVDAIGGVYYEVEETIYDKHWIIGRVLVPEGPQIMDGKTYLRYLQYRDDKSGQDYGRIDRQMSLLRETYHYLLQEGRITDIPATYRIYKDYVETDLSYKQIAALAYYARDLEATDDDLRFHTMRGDGQTQDGIWYQVLRQNERVQIIKEIFGKEVRPWPPIVLVDSPEYIEEQERIERLELFGERREDGDHNSGNEGEDKKESEEKRSIFDDLFDRDEQNGDRNGKEDDSGDQSGQDKKEEQEGVSKAIVPEVRGMSVEQAGQVLESRGFKVGGIVKRYYDFLDAGLVITADPLPGRKVTVGTVVTLIVSEGSKPEGQ